MIFFNYMEVMNLEFIKKNWKVALVVGIIAYTILVSFISIEIFKANTRRKLNQAFENAFSNISSYSNDN